MFNTYQKYNIYEDEWFKKIPSQWKKTRLQNVLCERNEKNSLIKETNILSLSMHQGVIPISEKLGNGGNKPKENLKDYKISYPNDIVINSMNVVVGSVGLNQYTGLISPAYYALYNRDKENNIKYWHYIFQSTIFQKTLFSLGKGILFKESENGKLNTIRIKISIDTLNRVYLPLPSKKEQNQIVSFLDQETQKIDNLIAKQEKLIELLEERRKSIISYAVTKGVNPNAKMKVSGVEWLGEVPEHWTVTAVKRLLEIPITDGPHETPEFVDDGIPFISAEAIFNSKIDFDKKRGFITSAANELYSKKYSPKLNDIYMVKSGATTGKVAIVETEEIFNIWSPLAVFRCQNEKINYKFLFYFFRSAQFYKALCLNWSYGTQQNIGMKTLGNIQVAFPSQTEQIEIVNHIEKENIKLDLLIQKEISLVEKLKEYRASIICHAVTGQIDVRDLAK